MTEKQYYQGTGRRKEAVARVQLFPGNGTIVVNGKTPEDYFGARTLLHYTIRLPLEITETMNSYEVRVKIRGGGIAGQADAMCHGVARALLDVNPDYRAILKKAGLLTRDARVKERKKVGLKRARKRPQYTKR